MSLDYPLTNNLAIKSEVGAWASVLHCQLVVPWDQLLLQSSPEPIRSKTALFQVILDRLLAADLPRVIQDSAHLLDSHFSLLAVATRRANALPEHTGSHVEQFYLQTNPHPAMISLDTYLENFTTQLWVALGQPSSGTVMKSLLQPILKAFIIISSNPWVIHKSIIRVSEALETLRTLPTDANSEGPSSPSNFKSNFSLACALLAHTPPDYNTFILDFLVHRLQQSKIAYCLYMGMWPLHSKFAELTNRVTRNLLRIYLPQMSPDAVATAMAALRHTFFATDSVELEPNPEEQQELRIKAMSVFPKILGQRSLPEDTFDYYLINQRLIISFLDLFMEIVS